MSDPVGVQWAIGRANERFMAGLITDEELEETARRLLSMRNRIDGGTASTQQSAPRSQSQGNGGQRVGFASEKQERWFKDLVGKAGLTDTEKHTVWEYASAALTGGRDGGISQAIDGLKSPQTAGQTASELLQRAEAWKAQQSSLPAPDTSGLPAA